MKTFKYKNKAYDVDDQNFLLDCDTWDDDFAVGMSREIGINQALTDRHWDVIHFIRNRFSETGACPVVHETSRALNLTPKAMQQLFPNGYFRGACLLAGISYKYGWVYFFGEPYTVSDQKHPDKKQKKTSDKVYRVDLFGSLVDYTEWDEDYAARRAWEMNIKTGLTDKHRQVIRFLRDSYAKTKKIPTIYECCDANNIDFDEFAELFPTGYHRGAIKIAGLPTFGKK